MRQLLSGTKSFKEKKIMNSRNVLLFAVILAIVFLFFMIISGCKIDVADPVWEKPFNVPPSPRITSVEPPQAPGGVITITINGENFASAPGTNTVYFDNTSSEVISSTSTSIVVRRPNIVSDSAVVKVVSSQALTAVKYSPYKVEQVMERYGDFTENIPLSVVVADNQDNLYVIEGRNVHKVTPTGEKTLFGPTNRTTLDAKIGPDGNLYLLGNNRAVDKVDVTSGEITRWIQMPSGKNVRYGDFDDFGNFYAGGNKTDLLVVESNLNIKTAAGFYTASDILAVRVFNNYVYVAVNRSDYADTSRIYRHMIDAGGNLGEQELVLDLRNSADFSSRIIKGLTFSASGIMFMATDAVNPIITFDPANGSIDYFYKEILRPYCKSFAWGSGNFIYMINGDAATGEEWTIYKVNAGLQGLQ